MQHKGTLRLETERLILRAFRAEDAAEMFKNWAGDAEATLYVSWPPHQEEAQSLAFIQQHLEQYKDPSHYEWAIYHKESAQVIGSLGAMQPNERTGCVELGYIISRPFWGQGITTEAARAVIRFLFEQVGVLRIQAKFDPQNAASGQVMRKCGMQYEGRLRRAICSNLGITDAHIYAILREDDQT